MYYMFKKLIITKKQNIIISLDKIIPKIIWKNFPFLIKYIQKSLKGDFSYEKI